MFWRTEFTSSEEKPADKSDSQTSAPTAAREPAETAGNEIGRVRPKLEFAGLPHGDYSQRVSAVFPKNPTSEKKAETSPAPYCNCGKCSGTVENASRYCCKADFLMAAGFSPDSCYTSSPEFERMVEQARKEKHCFASTRRQSVYTKVSAVLRNYKDVFPDRAKKNMETGTTQWPLPDCVVSHLRKTFRDLKDETKGHTGFQGALKKRFHPYGKQ